MRATGTGAREGYLAKVASGDRDGPCATRIVFAFHVRYMAMHVHGGKSALGGRLHLVFRTCRGNCRQWAEDEYATEQAQENECPIARVAGQGRVAARPSALR